MYKALVASGVATASLLGYCVYFDHARRSAPDYKDKIRAKRTAARNASRVSKSQKCHIRKMYGLKMMRSNFSKIRPQ